MKLNNFSIGRIYTLLYIIEIKLIIPNSNLQKMKYNSITLKKGYFIFYLFWQINIDKDM